MTDCCCDKTKFEITIILAGPDDVIIASAVGFLNIIVGNSALTSDSALSALTLDLGVFHMGDDYDKASHQPVFKAANILDHLQALHRWEPSLLI